MKTIFSRLLRLIVCLLLLQATLSAATVTWDGNGNSNNNGTWETTANWSSDALPATADTATLGDVTSGTRTITITTPETITKLTINQTTAGATNILQINDDLTITGGTPFAISAVTQSSVVINIADNKTLLVNAGATAITSTLDGTLNLGASSTFRLLTTSTGTFAATFNGPVNATAAGAQILLERGQNTIAYPVFNGLVHVVGSGSSLTMVSGTTASLKNSGYTFNGNDGSGNGVYLDSGTQLTLLGNTNFTFNTMAYLSSDSDSTPGVGTQMILGGNGTSTVACAPVVNFNGGLFLGANSETTVKGTSVTLNFGGTSTLNSGSKLKLAYNLLGNAGTASLTVNNGATLSMDGASIIFDNSYNSNGTANRNYTNNGTWTLDNGSSLIFTTSGGGLISGNNVGTGNKNLGIFNVYDGSTLEFRTLFNAGTFNLGSSTAGTSDATVQLGSPNNFFANADFFNGFSATGTAAPGTINILGDTYMGRTSVTAATGGAAATTSYLYNGYDGTNTSSGSVINIGDGTTPITFTVANNTAVTFRNETGNTTNLKANATFLLKSIQTSTSNGIVTFINNGTFTHAGKLQIQGNGNTTTNRALSSTGTYIVNGTSAAIEWLPGVGSGASVGGTINTFAISGTFSGSTTNDKLTFTNSAGDTKYNVIPMSFTNTAITPGNGSNGSGTSSIGALELVNANVTFGGATTITMDIGGTSASGLYDTFILSQTVGSGAALTLGGTTDTLNIILANGFLPASTQTYTLITATGGINGTFESLLFNGSALGSEYSLTYYSDHIDLTMAAMIPEPSTYILLLSGLAFLLFWKRKHLHLLNS